ncbi:MAG: stage 0 sporulation protein, partial [Longicatena sp.]
MSQDSHNEQRRDSHEKKENRTFKFIVFVSFKESKKIYTFGSDVDNFRIGDQVVVETVRGLELGEIVKESETFLPNGMEIKPIIRKATEKDLKQT